MPDFTKQFNQNTKKLVDLLNAVDFGRSKLPPEILEERRRSKYMCEMEYTLQIELVGKLERVIYPRIPADFGPIDEKLMELADRLTRYVRTGETLSAKMAFEALIRGIRDIRCNIPQNPAIPPEDYVSVNADYLEKWISLTQLAERCDQKETSLNAQRQAHEENAAQLEHSIDATCSRITEDPEFGNAFFHILNHDTPKDRSVWTSQQLETHLELVKYRLEKFTLEVSRRGLASQEQELLISRKMAENWFQRLFQVPPVEDPNLMNKYKEVMEEMLRELARSDLLAEEALQQQEKLTGALQQLDESSSFARQRQVAAESARKTLAEIQQLQQLRQAGADLRQAISLDSDSRN